LYGTFRINNISNQKKIKKIKATYNSNLFIGRLKVKLCWSVFMWNVKYGCTLVGFGNLIWPGACSMGIQ
jgi:hypothetical protein